LGARAAGAALGLATFAVRTGPALGAPSRGFTAAEVFGRGIGAHRLIGNSFIGDITGTVPVASSMKL
jgi:hypothetical protein